MELDNNTVRLIESLEYIVGKNFYNPNTSDRYRVKVGCTFRYKVTMQDADNGKKYDYKGKIYDASPETIGTIHYETGSNHLYIGDALVEILNYLEERYDLDFNELETNCYKYFDNTPILFEDEEDDDDDE